MNNSGFVTTIVPPAYVRGLPVSLVFMLPQELWAQFGGPAAQYSDNTVRNEAGTVLRDYTREFAGTRAGYLDLGGDITSNDVARNADGTPLAVKTTDPRDSNTAGGVTGDTAPVPEIFVPGVGPYEPVWDDARAGGWGAPIVEGTKVDGQYVASSMSRRDDRWIWPDGTITDAQRTRLGMTYDRAQAAREIKDRGPTPSIQWTGQQVIYAPTNVQPSQITTVLLPGGGTSTTDGTGRVVASSPGGGTDVQTLFSPAAPPPAGWDGTESGAGSVAPIVNVPPETGGYVLPGTNHVTGRPNTDSAPGSGGGTTTAPISAVLVDGPPAALVTPEGTMQVPQWALWLGAAVVLAMLFKGGK